MQVHFSESPAGEHLAIFSRRVGATADVSFGPTPNPDADVLISGRPRPEELEAMKKLWALVLPFAGVPEVTRERMKAYPEVAVYNLHHNAPATAEMAVALMMAAGRNLVPLDAGMRRGEWAGRTMPDAMGMRSGSMAFQGARALIIGYGEIGQRVARVCLSLGMEVEAIKRVVRAAFDGDVSLYAPSGLMERLARADVVLVTVPHTPETDGLLGFEQLGRMKTGAILVNVSRGAIVDEEALFKALETKHLGGAGLDVWWQYPSKCEDVAPPSKFDFASLPNVVMTPHLGGTNRDSERRRMEALAELVGALASGKQMRRVDLAKGY
jgi:phosphoglycerate dehydrogenase-like enzyme